MLETGEKLDARQRLEEMEREMQTGRVKALPPKEFNDFVAEYEKLLNSKRGIYRFAAMF